MENGPDQELQANLREPVRSATYSGMLLSGTLGWQFNDDEMRIDLADLCRRSGAQLILANANGLDLQSRLLHFDDHESLAFEALSIGVGSMPAAWDNYLNATLLVSIKPMQTFLQRLADRLNQCGEAAPPPAS